MKNEGASEVRTQVNVIAMIGFSENLQARVRGSRMTRSKSSLSIVKP